MFGMPFTGMASKNPVIFQGQDHGSIAPGKYADLLIFDDDIRISSMLIVAGIRQ